MRAVSALFALGILVLAGCLGPASLPPAPASDHAALGAWSLDCTLGSHEKMLNASWAQDCEARASHTQGQKQETWLAINPTDPRNVVIGAKDLNPESSKGCVWNGVFVTHDAGKTWKDVVIGGKYADRKPGDELYGYACNTDPDFQFTKDGALHYGVEAYNFLGQNSDGIAPQNPLSGPLAALAVIPGWKIVLATSHDGGDTWPDLITYQQDLVVVTDYSRMTVSPTSQAIIEAISSEAGSCHVLVSRDGGKTADPLVIVQPKEAQAFGCDVVAAAPDGTVVLGFGAVDPSDTSGTTLQHVFVRSTDDATTFLDSNVGFSYLGIPQFNESKYRVGSGMELAYDLTGGAGKGTLYAAYAARGPMGGDESEVFVRSSKDHGKTWGEPVRVNSDDTTTSHQWMPNIAVAGDGSLHVVYMDKRYTAEHKLIDYTHAVSFDGGKTWANERVSTVPFDGELGKHQEGFPFIGDYLGVAAVGDDVWAGFPDASNGNTTVIAAAHVHRSA